jgi:hypothetical protein
MHVKEITVDGFKSYAQRVVIPGFDPQFNAITGLNGSGKSNILDSICFVLGITNLQQVRLRAPRHPHDRAPAPAPPHPPPPLTRHPRISHHHRSAPTASRTWSTSRARRA